MQDIKDKEVSEKLNGTYELSAENKAFLKALIKAPGTSRNYLVTSEKSLAENFGDEWKVTLKAFGISNFKPNGNGMVNILRDDCTRSLLVNPESSIITYKVDPAATKKQGIDNL